MRCFLALFICSIITIAFSTEVEYEEIDWSQVKSGDILPEELEGDLPIEPFDNARVRIVGGKPAAARQFPYQVGLLARLTTGGMSWCGGSLISPQWVLTAGHCVNQVTQVTVIIGAHNKNNPQEQGQIRMEVGSWNFKTHPGYIHRTLNNDIALIKLPRSVPLNSQIQTIKLAKPNTQTEGRIATASGWGIFSDSKRQVSSVLRYADLTMINIAYCRQAYGQFARNTNICTDGSRRTSICQGDSGGPLVMNDNGHKVLVGLSSFGSTAGCEAGLPAAFTKVSSYLSWIAQETGIHP